MEKFSLQGPKLISFFLILINSVSLIINFAQIFVPFFIAEAREGLGGLGVVYGSLALPANLLFFTGSILLLKKTSVGWFISSANLVFILFTALLFNRYGGPDLLGLINPYRPLLVFFSTAWGLHYIAFSLSTFYFILGGAEVYS